LTLSIKAGETSSKNEDEGGGVYKLNDKSIDTWIRVDSVYLIDCIHCPLYGPCVVSPWNFLYYKEARIFHEYINEIFFFPALFRKRKSGRNILYKILILSLLFAQKDDKFLFFYFPEIHFSCGIFYTVFFFFPPRSLPILTSCLWSCLHYILFEVYVEFIIWFAKEILAVSLWFGY